MLCDPGMKIVTPMACIIPSTALYSKVISQNCFICTDYIKCQTSWEDDYELWVGMDLEGGRRHLFEGINPKIGGANE